MEKINEEIKLSAVISAVYLTEEHYRITKECLESLNNVDETILIECGERSSDFKVDVKLHFRDLLNSNVYPSIKVYNLGAKLVTGNYIIFLNNDIRVIEGNLRDLCIPNTATCPLVNGKRPNCDLWGMFNVVPTKVHRAIGGFDERYGYYYADNDYNEKLKEAKIRTMCIDRVDVFHYGGKTIHPVAKKLGVNVVKIEEKSKKRFKEKWKK